MKLILCVVILSGVTILFTNVKALKLYCYESETIGKQITLHDYEQIYELRKVVTYNAKCMYECMLRSGGMVKVDGLVKGNELLNFLKTSGKYDAEILTNMTKIMDSCKNHKHLSEDKCLTVGLFLQCSTEEANKYNMTRETMLRAIRAPFDAQKRTYVWIDNLEFENKNYTI